MEEYDLLRKTGHGPFEVTSWITARAPKERERFDAETLFRLSRVENLFRSGASEHGETSL